MLLDLFLLDQEVVQTMTPIFICVRTLIIISHPRDRDGSEVGMSQKVGRLTIGSLRLRLVLKRSCTRLFLNLMLLIQALHGACMLMRLLAIITSQLLWSG